MLSGLCVRILEAISECYTCVHILTCDDPQSHLLMLHLCAHSFVCEDPQIHLCVFLCVNPQPHTEEGYHRES